MHNTGKKLSVLTLMMLIVAAVASIRGLPSTAEQGMQLIFFLGFSALVFFVPTSLVSAELATGWKGGIFAWVKEAFGDRWGFVAIWLQWIQNVAWYPTVLSFAAAAIAYVIDPALANDGMFTALVIISVYWAATFIALRGINVAGVVGSWGVILGTLLPGAFIILLGILYILQGHPSAIPLRVEDIVPQSFSLPVIVFTVGILLSYAGIEMNANHARDVKDPAKSFPIAILGAGIITVVLAMLGSLAIAIVVPIHELSLTAGVMEAYTIFLRTFDISWAMPMIALLLLIGIFGGVVTWIAGPSRGLLEVGQAGYLPPFFQQTNKHGVQKNILLTQGVIVTLLALLFVFLPNVSSSYWLLTSMTIQVYLLMYILMFLAAIRLRKTQPQVIRAYKVPMLSFVGGVGLVACIAAFLLGFVAPSTWTEGSFLYVSILASGIIFLSCGPFIFYSLRKKSWRQP
ncbi:MAG: amino acid permease [Patescibacteria group bacterium]